MEPQQPTSVPANGAPPVPVGYVMNAAVQSNTPPAGQVLYEAPTPGSLPTTLAFDQEQYVQAKQSLKRSNWLFMGMLGFGLLAVLSSTAHLNETIGMGLLVTASICWIAACSEYLRSKGYPRILTFLSFLGLIGLLIMIVLPNKMKQLAHPVQQVRHTFGKRLLWGILAVFVLLIGVRLLLG